MRQILLRLYLHVQNMFGYVYAVSVRTAEMNDVLGSCAYSKAVQATLKRDVRTKGMSVTFVAGALAVRRLLFDKLIP